MPATVAQSVAAQPCHAAASKYRPVLLALAIVFAAATLLYSAAWMYYIRQASTQVEIGIDESDNFRRNRDQHRAQGQPGGKGWAEGQGPHRRRQWKQRRFSSGVESE